jgi:hypothetical protein
MKSSIFMDDRITTEPNIDQKYKHKGIIEVSHTVVINPFNQIFVYCFRNNYNNEYNICKIKCLVKIQEILNKKHKKNLLDNYKVVNIRFRRIIGLTTVTVNACGTLLYKDQKPLF